MISVVRSNVSANHHDSVTTLSATGISGPPRTPFAGCDSAPRYADLRPERAQGAEVEVGGPLLGGARHDDGLVAAADGGALGEDVVVGRLDLVEDGGADQPDQRPCADPDPAQQGRPLT
jgi:hypothetical protein